jgi:hypothetical protein
VQLQSDVLHRDEMLRLIQEQLADLAIGRDDDSLL